MSTKLAAKYNVPESSVFGIATRYNQQQSKRTLSRGLAKRGYKHNKCTAQADGLGFAARAVGFHGQADTTCQPTPCVWGTDSQAAVAARPSSIFSVADHGDP
ncbi:hypothetical protein M0657_008416 [Pyricularia oryzae]|nr:hypothetical protein M9X92_010378 [Pyricularia oryzae]KAI7916753.1 hypothetical protein M0657_008416 [Pyricularia oryzae]